MRCFFLSTIFLISASIYSAGKPLSLRKKLVRHTVQEPSWTTLVASAPVDTRNIPSSTSTTTSPLASDHKQQHHGISLMGLVINVVADLCPHGMLPLAYGFAQGGPNGIVPAIALIALFGTMSAYSMTAFAGLSEEVGANTIADIWGKLKSPKTQWIVDLSIMALCYGCCVFYSAFAGDIFGALSQVLGLNISRATSLLLISVGLLLPLCLMKDLSALQVSSSLGVFGIFYTAFFHVKRLLDKSYVPGSYLLKFVEPHLRPRFPSPMFSLFRMNRGTLVLANMLCVAFLAHYNAINYFRELNDTHRKYVKGISLGFGISAGVFVTMMLVGYRLFGQSTLPLILNNFPRTEDFYATISRICIGSAIVFAYPLMFAGLKSAMFSLMDARHREKQIATYKKQLNGATHVTQPLVLTPVDENIKTTGILLALSSITAIAVQCGEEDVAVVLGIVGSVFGCFVAYVLPNYMKMVHQRQRQRAGLKNNKVEVIANHVMMSLGILFSILGVWVTIQDASVSHHPHHT